MSRREKARKQSLGVLAGILNGKSMSEAERAPQPIESTPTPAVVPRGPITGAESRAANLEAKRRALEANAMKSAAARAPRPVDTANEGRRAKMLEAQALRDRRAQELHGAKSLRSRGWVPEDDMPAGVYRARGTAEPSVDARVRGVLGEKPAEKAGRAKNRERSKRGANR